MLQNEKTSTHQSSRGKASPPRKEIGPSSQCWHLPPVPGHCSWASQHTVIFKDKRPHSQDCGHKNVNIKWPSQSCQWAGVKQIAGPCGQSWMVLCGTGPTYLLILCSCSYALNMSLASLLSAQQAQKPSRCHRHPQDLSHLSWLREETLEVLE